MSFAVTLRFDEASAPAVEAMWRLLAECGIDADRNELGYPPHVTLAIYGDDAPFNRLQDGLALCASRWNAVPVSLSGFGLFPGSKSILWAAPVVTQQLLAVHTELQDILLELPVHAHYQTGAWVPHVTLSGPLVDPTRALAALIPLWRPLTGSLNRLDLVRFRPIKVMASIPLST
jgi:2'-5' RNA ligase